MTEQRTELQEFRGAAGQRRLVREAAVAQVLRFEASDKYVVAHAPGVEVTLSEPIKALAGEFAGAFLRVHRAHLVRPELIVATYPKGAGCYDLELAGHSERVPLARRYYRHLVAARPDLRRNPGGHPGARRAASSK